MNKSNEELRQEIDAQAHKAAAEWEKATSAAKESEEEIRRLTAEMEEESSSRAAPAISG
jgi:hypothetical protein